MFKRLAAGMTRTRDRFKSGLKDLVQRREPLDAETLDGLEETLLSADVGSATTDAIIERLRKLRPDADAPAPIAVIRDELVACLEGAAAPEEQREGQPHVVLVVGVNGVGKTTTIAKLAARLQGEGLSVMLAAGDTFRAAAVEQLAAWGARLELPVIAQEIGSDSASVLYDALSAARARGVDVLLADTAGRLQTKSTLMEELKKVCRVMKKLDPEAPHETLLVVDATTGQNAVSQVREFSAAVPLDGLVLTKLDGTAKGGIVFRLTEEFKVPVKYVGVGEGADDLAVFDPAQFVEALIEVNTD